MNSAYSRVKKFQAAFGFPNPDVPCILDTDRAMCRAEWMQAEIREFVEARNMTDQVDAMLDVMYFALGTLVEMGVSCPDELFDVVHSCNMSKLGNTGEIILRESDGKLLKPQGWQPPEPQIQKILNRLIRQKKEANRREAMACCN